MNKKGAELSLNVIIIAILVLLVLVVISVIFLSRTSNVNKDISSCDSKSGKCFLKCGSEDEGSQDYKFPLPSSVATCKDVDGQKMVCCTQMTLN